MTDRPEILGELASIIAWLQGIRDTLSDPTLSGEYQEIRFAQLLLRDALASIQSKVSGDSPKEAA